PRHYLDVEHIPLSENGKADRDALQEILDARLAADAALLDARLAEEAALHDEAPAILWAFRRVLGDPRLTADGDFFDAGGDSLQALTIVRLLRDEHGLRLGVRDLLEHPSAARLAVFLAAGLEAEDEYVLMERDAALAPGEQIAAAD